MLGLTGFGMWWTEQEAEMDVLTPEAAVHAGNACCMTNIAVHSRQHERGREESTSYEYSGDGKVVGLRWPATSWRGGAGGLFLKGEGQFSRRER